MLSLPCLPISVLDGAIAGPAALAGALRPRLGPHPVPQSDPRVRGLLLEFGAGADDLALLRAEAPELVALVAQFAREPEAIYALAVNETPPSSPDSFMLRPHVDRRWLGDGFGCAPPRWTTVVFLDFPPTGQGGELVVFPREAFDDAEPVSRNDARQTVMSKRGALVAPLPGRACRLAGDLPHAALGYSAAPDDPWRLALVLAEFARNPDDPTFLPHHFVGSSFLPAPPKKSLKAPPRLLKKLLT